MKCSEFDHIVSSNLHFHFREWLPADKPKALVFLIHGLSDHGGRFSGVAETLTRNGFVFIAPDLRGNGRSSGKKGHFDSYDQVMDDLDLLIEIARQKHRDIPLFIYGQSMGGNLALNYGLRRGQNLSGIIASSPWLRLTRPPNPLVQGIGSAIGKIFPGLVIPNGLVAEDLTHTKSISDAYRNDPLVHGKISLNTFRIITESGEWAIQNAHRLKFPLLLLHGTSDNITSMEASREFSNKLQAEHTFETWEGLRHELHNEPSSENVLSHIVNWMDSLLLKNLRQSPD